MSRNGGSTANGLAGAGLMTSSANVAGVGVAGGVGMDPSASNGDISGVHRQGQREMTRKCFFHYRAGALVLSIYLGSLRLNLLQCKFNGLVSKSRASPSSGTDSGLAAAVALRLGRVHDAQAGLGGGGVGRQGGRGARGRHAAEEQPERHAASGQQRVGALLRPNSIKPKLCYFPNLKIAL